MYLLGSGHKRSSRPRTLGGKKTGGFSILGSFKKLAGAVLRGLKTAIVAVGNIAQDVLDFVNMFPALKKVLQVRVPIPGIGLVSVHGLLKGVAITGRITERLANAFEVYANGGDFEAIVKELPIADIVMFVLAPIADVFKGVLSLTRLDTPEGVKRIQQLAKSLKALFDRIPAPVKGAVLKGIEEKLGFRLPPDLKTMIIGKSK